MLWTMRPKARGLVQHGGPPGWLEESDPARCDGRFMPPALTDHTSCPGLGLLSCERLAIPAAVSDVLVLNVLYTNLRHEIYHAKKAWVKTLVRPVRLSGYVQAVSV